MDKVLSKLQSASFADYLGDVVRHSPEDATLKINVGLHAAARTDDKLFTSRLYTELLRIIASAQPGTTMLGTADISARTESNQQQSGGTADTTDILDVEDVLGSLLTTDKSLDVDAFFLWFPVRS